MVFRAFYPVFQLTDFLPPLTQCPMSLRGDGVGNLIQDGPHPSSVLCISDGPESESLPCMLRRLRAALAYGYLQGTQKALGCHHISLFYFLPPS